MKIVTFIIIIRLSFKIIIIILWSSFLPYICVLMMWFSLHTTAV